MATHSLTGASGAHRWMRCPGSVALAKRFRFERRDSKESAEGTAAHEALATVLRNPEMEPWELAGMTFGEFTVDDDMLDAVKTGVDVCRSLITPAVQVLLETNISHRAIEGFRGTVDFGTVTDSLLNVVDYKHGAGVVVECERNPQMMYYAYGILLKHPSVKHVTLRIVQPRAYHDDGPVRRWKTTAKEIHTWAETELIPAMERTRREVSFDAGPHCRFCPAKLVCPMLRSLFEAACTTDARDIPQMDSATLGECYRLTAPVRMICKAIDDEVTHRLHQGETVPGTKLVKRRADRTWKDGAFDFFLTKIGSDACEPVKLKSPAQMEKVNSEAKKLVKAWAYTPDAGYTVADADDKRAAITIPKTAERFAGYLEKQK